MKKPRQVGKPMTGLSTTKELIVMQKAKVYQFPKRGRFVKAKPRALTAERQTKGNQQIAKLRALIEEGRS